MNHLLLKAKCNYLNWVIFLTIWTTIGPGPAFALQAKPLDSASTDGTEHSQLTEAGASTASSSRTQVGINGAQPGAVKEADSVTRLPETVFDLNASDSVAMPANGYSLLPYEFSIADGKRGWVVFMPSVESPFADTPLNEKLYAMATQDQKANFWNPLRLCRRGSQQLSTPAYGDGKIYLPEGNIPMCFDAFNCQTGDLLWRTNSSVGTGAEASSATYSAGNCFVCAQNCFVLHGTDGQNQWISDYEDKYFQPCIANGCLYLAFYGSDPTLELQTKISELNKKAVQMKAYHRLFAKRRDIHQITSVLAPFKVWVSNAGAHEGPISKFRLFTEPFRYEEQKCQREARQLKELQRRKSVFLECFRLDTYQRTWMVELTDTPISAPVAAGDKIYINCCDGSLFCINSKDGSIVRQERRNDHAAPLVVAGKIVTLSGTDEQESRDRTWNACTNVGYQGPRPAVSKDLLIRTENNIVEAIELSSGRLVWKTTFINREQRLPFGLRDGTPDFFAPPSVGTNCVYLVSREGHIISLSLADGSVRFSYATHLPMYSQACLANGNVYVGTKNGCLICIKTGDMDADGWYAFGGDSTHNKGE